MIPTSALMREASRYSWTLSATVDVLYGVTPVPDAQDIPVIDGSYSMDRTARIRTSGSMTLATTAIQDYGINTKTTRLRVKRGVESLGHSEVVQLGIWRVDETKRTADGLTEITFSDLGAYITDARFLIPRTPDSSLTCVELITDLIIEAVPHAVVRVLATADHPVLLRAPWEKDRWEAIDALAESIDAEVYVNYAGEFVIADIPAINSGAAVMTLDEGEGGVLIEREEGDTRDQVYNAVSVSNGSTNPSTPLVWAWAYDNDPTSPTYFYGEFGQKPRFYVNQNFTTTEQCQQTADGLLAQSLAAHQSLTASSLPLFFLEPGDLVQIRHLDRSLAVHLLTKTSGGLGLAGSMSLETLSSKIIARDAE